LSLFAIATISTNATTWDEPWADKVIKNADCFVLAKVDSFNINKGVYIEIIKNLGGTNLSGKIAITNFYYVELTSMSGGEGPEFHFEGVKNCYFFIKKNDKGQYCIATPTTGFDYVQDTSIVATYRHSYHKALVPVTVYEKTMTAIFNNYHGQPYDTKYINEYVNKYLSMASANPAKDMNLFFLQHVALECVHHLKLQGYYSKIVPFLKDTGNFHAQVSAARALVAYNTPECKEQLLKIIADTSQIHFVQVICIWTLEEFKPKELKPQLVKIEATASSEETGFGGNIMDPRVGTEFPDVKTALDELIKQLD